MRRIHPWRNDPICRIDVTGFLSIMVVFLAIFLAPVYSGVDMPTSTVDLPYAGYLISLREADREDAIHLYVKRDGHIYLNTTQISREQLPGKIREALKQGSRPTVFISVDRHARYAEVSSTLDGIRAAGITRIAFVAESR